MLLPQSGRQNFLFLIQMDTLARRGEHPDVWKAVSASNTAELRGLPRIKIRLTALFSSTAHPRTSPITKSCVCLDQHEGKN